MPLLCLRGTSDVMKPEEKRGLSSGVAGLRYGPPERAVKAIV